MAEIQDNPFQHPPFFVKGTLSDAGKTIQLVDEDGRAHTFHVDEALALIEARLYTERYGDLFINTAEFEAIPVRSTHGHS